MIATNQAASVASVSIPTVGQKRLVIVGEYALWRSSH